MTIGGGGLCLGMLFSRYWKFVASWRLWISLAALVALDAICIRFFLEQMRELSLWNIDCILAFEFVATIFFLNWFLDTKKARAEISRRKQL